ncbi:MAG: hypothetical protein AB7N70_28795 [Dehalococcoidia bacterium]
MDIRPSLQLKVMIKAMEQVVLPAVDSSNRIAVEQAGLVLTSLRVLEQRLPLWRAYVRDELTRLVRLVDDIVALDDVAQAGAPDLVAAAGSARSLIGRPDAEAPELEQAAIDLRNGIGQLIADWESRGVTIHGTSVGRLVLDASKTQLDRERGWLLPFGFESDPSAIVPIERQLHLANGPR